MRTISCLIPDIQIVMSSVCKLYVHQQVNISQSAASRWCASIAGVCVVRLIHTLHAVGPTSCQFKQPIYYRLSGCFTVQCIEKHDNSLRPSRPNMCVWWATIMLEKRGAHIAPSILTGVVASSIWRGLRKCHRLEVQTQEYGPHAVGSPFT